MGAVQWILWDRLSSGIEALNNALFSGQIKSAQADLQIALY
jgi:hypothetical protein